MQEVSSAQGREAIALFVDSGGASRAREFYILLLIVVSR